MFVMMTHGGTILTTEHVALESDLNGKQEGS